jgi:hypothetical protein
MLDAMETVEIKFADGQEVEAAPKPRPKVVKYLLKAKCTRCHGTGKEPGRTVIPLHWDDILEQLDAAGDQRAKYSDARGEDWHHFNAAWDRIRALWPAAQEMGIPQGMAAQAVGVTRAQFSAQIAKGRTTS